jgi:3-oxoacyl-[acyl-carrier-protein] synthase II
VLGQGQATAIVGMGVVGPCGRGPEALWLSLLNGHSNRRPISHFETYGSATATVGLVPGEEERAGKPDRLTELLTAAVGDALAATTEDRSRIALVVGTTDAGDPRRGGVRTAEEAAERLELGGEAIAIGTASAAGGSVLCVARELLLAGEVQTVVAAGVDRVTATAFHGLRSLRTLSSEGCRPFSADRAGIAIAEGAAALVLTAPREEGSRRGPRLLGCGSNNRAGQLTLPEVGGIAAALEAALADAGLAPEDVAMVNAHGPGTRRGDAIEIEALRMVFGARLPEIALVSTKGVLWHWQGAAGLVEAIACVLAHARGTVPPTHGAAPVDPAWADLDVVLEPRPLGRGVSVSISCGLDGINTAAVLTA